MTKIIGILLIVFSFAFVFFRCGLVFYRFFHIENWREKMELGTFEGEEADIAKMTAYAAGLLAFIIFMAFIAVLLVMERGW